jgi:hypothetical protein
MSLDDLVLLPISSKYTYVEFFPPPWPIVNMHNVPCFRHRLNTDAISDMVVVKKIRQFCLITPQNHLPPGYTQQQLAEVLGVDQALVSRALNNASAPLSPLKNTKKRNKRQDAFEVQYQDLVFLVTGFWVWIYMVECIKLLHPQFFNQLLLRNHQSSNSRDSPMSRDLQLKCINDKGAHKKQKIGATTVVVCTTDKCEVTRVHPYVHVTYKSQLQLLFCFLCVECAATWQSISGFQ